MSFYNRRHFLKTSAAGATLVNLGFLKPLSWAVAKDIAINSNYIKFGPEMDPLVKLIRNTKRENCVPVFIEKLKSGLSYQQFHGALFLAASETADMHHVAQVYAAHRISAQCKIEERLLPLFWVLDRIKRGHEYDGYEKTTLRQLSRTLPTAGNSGAFLKQAVLEGDKDQAELAIVALARSEGAAQAMYRLWEYAPRDLVGTMGHNQIGVSNAWRTLSTIGWQHAETSLRYLAREVSRPKVDNNYEANITRMNQTVSQLPAQWASNTSNNSVTLELYHLLRTPNPAASCDYICKALIKGDATAGAIWDAISLVSADIIFRYKTGGDALGSYLIHIITSTNALRYGFQFVQPSNIRLLQLLQAAALVSSFFVRSAIKQNQLRPMNLIEDLNNINLRTSNTIQDVFKMLPEKKHFNNKHNLDQRTASDNACKNAFSLLQNPKNEHAFLQTARSLLCVKATTDAHDYKFPAALFEDAYQVSSQWRPYLLAASVHALHGTSSTDTPVLIKARETI